MGDTKVVFGYKYDGSKINVIYQGSVNVRDGSSSHHLDTAGTGSDMSVEDYEATLGVQLPLGTMVTVSKVPDNFMVSANLNVSF